MEAYTSTLGLLIHSRTHLLTHLIICLPKALFSIWLPSFYSLTYSSLRIQVFFPFEAYPWVPDLFICYFKEVVKIKNFIFSNLQKYFFLPDSGKIPYISGFSRINKM